ncbi:twin-arginine translocase TatA/TatE family subunit [Desulforamulus aquiferis]|uniref:Sec-independent protein translocase protein TatA n=1 Tax=Desulforamulus aquiferis TaxID=1397668 RepID=A0AAW7ZAH0_9FIRM|nr:twin-arginine translocase TatA/TatE family subunit [Desulforamulus aquiferis]MDO7786322.1 twin-arginine translocase TatA/TatE family subunit [Desulforamulus aquiferis]RYD06166.1 hypothetical protein N752_04565 [Desulforamulus aquiferis]
MYGAFQPSHLLLVLVVVLIIFGPGKLKGLGKSLGESIRDFKTEITKEENKDDKDNNTELKKS